MCHFLYLASPLTLSEVRSMLPRGLAADLLAPSDARRVRALAPEAQTAARLLVGACSCDLYLQRGPERHEETELRHRYRNLRLDRQAIIHAIDRHRRGEHPRRDLALWQQALAAFVAEHARNAGDTGYYREFSAGPLHGLERDAEAVPLPLHTVTHEPAAWLQENQPALVTRA
jgi:hypothetical protein